MGKVDQGSASQQPTTGEPRQEPIDRGGVAEFTVYVVGGATGEYSDRSEWLVRAFWSEAEARAYVEFLAAERQKLPPRAGYDYEDARKIEDAMRAFDPSFSEDYTGTSWWVSSVPLGNSVAPGSACGGLPDAELGPGSASQSLPKEPE